MPTSIFVRIFMVIAIAVSSNIAIAQSSSIHLELLGQASIPHNLNFKDTPIGGLSGLSYNPQTDAYFVISDDRSDLAKARFYSFRLELNAEHQLEKDGIHFENVHFLRTQEGTFYIEGGIDPEGIVFTSKGLLYISSEGVPGKNIAPFINAYNETGAFVEELFVPEAYRPAHASADVKQGVRNNLGFEGLTASPDGSKLYAGNENALWQDGPSADAKSESPSRLIIYDLPADSILHEFIYMVDRVHYESTQTDMFAVNGLTALLALDNIGSLLALERSFVAGQGNRIALYAINTQGATDIKGIADLQRYEESPQPVKKELVAYLNDYDITIDNFEGLTLGPGLDGGGRLLLMVSDNNFSETQQTLFTAFRIKRLR